MQVSVKADIKAVQKSLDKTQRSLIPKAASDALNYVAWLASQKRLREKAQEIFAGGAVAYTRGAFRFAKSTAKSLTAEVFIDPDRDRYMRFQIAGGRRTPDRKKIWVPTRNTKLNRYGNIPRATMRRMIGDREKFFKGIPRGLHGESNNGIWERYGRTATHPRGKNIRMVARYVSSTQYSPLFPFAEITEGVVFGNQRFARKFNERLSAALRKRARVLPSG